MNKIQRSTGINQSLNDARKTENKNRESYAWTSKNTNDGGDVMRESQETGLYVP